MQSLYKRVCEYMELDERVEVLNNRFQVPTNFKPSKGSHHGHHLLLLLISISIQSARCFNFAVLASAHSNFHALLRGHQFKESSFLSSPSWGLPEFVAQRSILMAVCHPSTSYHANYLVSAILSEMGEKGFRKGLTSFSSFQDALRPSLWQLSKFMVLSRHSRCWKQCIPLGYTFPSALETFKPFFVPFAGTSRDVRAGSGFSKHSLFY